MYIVNPKVIPKDKMYKCNGLIANWLIFQANLPLLARDGREFIFARTDVLEECLERLPFWMKVFKKF